MRNAVLFDIHGNIDALDAVLADAAAAGCHGLILGGDYAYMGPAPDDVVDRLRQQPDPIIAVRGNTDRMIVLGDDTVARWAADQLGAERVEWLRLLPERETIAEHRATLVHATPRSDEELLTPSTPDFRAEAMLVAVHTTLLLCGHIHVQYRRQVGDVEIVNPGSVGLPFDDQTTAAWAIADDGTIELRRTAYDIERALARLAAAVTHPEQALTERRLRTAHS